jgi:PAT family beta-lactamase induction signal transducer AmpG
MLGLGFSAGLPLLLVFGTLSVWLRELGISRTAIGFLSWVGFAYGFKFLWAPLVDRWRLPLLGRLGRRRSWILLAQLGIAAGLLLMAFTDPAAHVLHMAAFAVLVAFSSATQDVAIDAWRIEIAEQDLQGAMAGAYQLGYRIALFAAGAGALLSAEYFGWHQAYLIMAALTLTGMATVLLVAEPATRTDAATAAREEGTAALVRRVALFPAWMQRLVAHVANAAIHPFIDFFKRHGVLALAILVFIGAFRLSDYVMGIMANPFYVDLGFTKEQIAQVSKTYGVFVGIAGALLGGVIVARFGIARPLIASAFLIAATNLMFAWLATAGPDMTLFALTISVENLVGGASGSVFIAYLSSLTNQTYTATQYALFSSFMTLPGKFLGGFSGVVVDKTDYVTFFSYTALVGIPAVLLSIYLMRRLPPSSAKSGPAKAGAAPPDI